MESKKYLYAAVGAPVAVAKTARDRANEVRVRMNERRDSTLKDARELIDRWADEGHKVVDQLSDTKAIDELTSKVDFDQVQTQVSKLRDQLEEMLATWRTNFSPKPDVVETVAETISEPAKKAEPAKKPASTKTASTKTASTKTASTKTSAKGSTAKTTSAKATGAKTTAAKTTAAKSTSAKGSTGKSTDTKDESKAS